jgi:hypothetical protein
MGLLYFFYYYYYYYYYWNYLPVPVAAWFKAWVCGRSPTEVVGSNPTGGMDVCLL